MTIVHLRAASTTVREHPAVDSNPQIDHNTSNRSNWLPITIHMNLRLSKTTARSLTHLSRPSQTGSTLSNPSLPCKHPPSRRTTGTLTWTQLMALLLLCTAPPTTSLTSLEIEVAVEALKVVMPKQPLCRGARLRSSCHTRANSSRRQHCKAVKGWRPHRSGQHRHLVTAVAWQARYKQDYDFE